MQETVKSLLAQQKGILAADESFPSIKKRFESLDIESTDETRGAYRDMLFTTPQISEFISGVILFDETVRQTTTEGVLFPEFLISNGIVPGIKVDLGTKQLPFFENEKITEGLDGLSERLKNYFELGARFSKWRAVITIGTQIPSDYAISVNMATLARFAALSQEANIVPIVEPEVLMDGAHTAEVCEQVTLRVHQSLFASLNSARVVLENTILKTNMVVPGRDSDQKQDSDKVAEMTVRCLKNGVPTSLGGIVFLSGGMSDIVATQNLNAINKISTSPWRLTFSYGRALQDSALKVWGGKLENKLAGQKAFYKRAKLNGLASIGQYSNELENQEVLWQS